MVVGMSILAEPAAAYVLLWSRAFLGTVFLLSLLGKVHSRAAYTRFLDAAEQLARPTPGRGPAPLGLSGRGLAPLGLLGEAAIPVLLLFDRSQVAGFACILMLLTAFTALLVREYRRGARVACNCFGTSRAPIGRLELGRNGVLMLVAAWGLALARISGAGAGPVTPDGTAVALAFGFASAALIPVADVVHGLFVTPTVQGK